MPQKYSREFRGRTVGLAFDKLRYNPGVQRAEIISDTGLGVLIVVNHCIAGWFKKRQAGEKPEVRRVEFSEIRRLRKENAEIKRTNEILKLESAFFAKELDHPGTK